MSVRLFVEGGGDGKDTRTECRRAFRLLLEKAGLAGSMPSVIASGSRAEAYRDFCSALRGNLDSPYLLVDSEAALPEQSSPWSHLQARTTDRWTRPEEATDDQCHLMVQTMETWLVADNARLGEFFGNGFQANAIPRTTPIEGKPKAEVLAALEHATRDCKQPYRKGAVSFRVLAEVDPAKLRTACWWADRFFTALERASQTIF